MIFGIGTDIIDIRRIEATLARRGDRFAEKVLGANELQVFRARSARVPQRGLSYLATRFSAKEAFSKAIGLGMRSPMTWRACEIVKAASGKPTIQLHGALAEWFAQRRLVAHVSLSDETDYAAAFVVVEIQPPPGRPQAVTPPRGAGAEGASGANQPPGRPQAVTPPRGASAEGDFGANHESAST